MTHVPSEEPATRRKHPGLDSCHLHRRTLLESDIPNHWFCPACHPGLVAPAVPVRERSLDDVEAKWADGRIDQRGALRAAYDAGLLAGPPQTVTRDKLIALMGDFDRAPDGTHYGDLIDKHFPGLDVVEG